MKKLITKLYILGSMVLTVVFMFYIWELTFGHLIEANHFRENAVALASMKVQDEKEIAKTVFQKTILDGDETVKHYLGYRVLEEKRIKDHFHHIDFEFIPDKWSYCIECHADTPHDKIKELRAFGNMHASYIACQTCHVRLEGTEKTGVFKWYDRVTGEIVPSPVNAMVSPGAYGSKILPFARISGKLQRIDTQEQIDFTREYREKEKTLTDIQKSKAQKIIHKIVSEKPYMCEDCHQQEAPLLSFEDLGYPKRRIDAFVSTEVVGMIRKYTKFYMPRMLQPGFADEKPANKS